MIMSTELELKVWFSDEIAYGQRFISIVNHIAQNKNFIPEWSSFRIVQHAPGNIIKRIPNIEGVSQMRNVFQEFTSEDHKVSVYLPMKCWRFVNGKPELGVIMASISVNGNEYVKQLGLDRAFEGDASVTLLSAGPFTEIINEESELDSSINIKVKENNTALIDTITDMSSFFNIEKMHLFSNNGNSVLHNSHLCYYNDYNVLIEDLTEYHNLLRYGNKKYGYKSSATLSIAEDAYYFHEWRAPEMKSAILDLMQLTSNSVLDINPEKIQRLLSSGKYDYIENENKIMILEFPFFVNAFVDRFIFEMLM